MSPQIPRPQWLSGVPVVPEDAPKPERAPAGHTTPGTVRGTPLYDRLWNLIDDRIADDRFTLVDIADRIAGAIFADTDLLDALVAYRQQQTATRYVVRSVDDDENDQWTLDAAKAEQASLRHEFPETDWRIYVLTDITEGNTE